MSGSGGGLRAGHFHRLPGGYGVAIRKRRPQSAICHRSANYMPHYGHGAAVAVAVAVGDQQPHPAAISAGRSADQYTPPCSSGGTVLIGRALGGENLGSSRFSTRYLLLGLLTGVAFGPWQRLHSKATPSLSDVRRQDLRNKLRLAIASSFANPSVQKDRIQLAKSALSR